IVHVALSAIVAAVFMAIGTLVETETPRLRRWTTVFLVGAAGGAISIVAFPGLLGGPFVDVDPIVRTRWLDQVTELHPVWSDASITDWVFRLAPLLVGTVAAWRLLGRRVGASLEAQTAVLWFSIYAVLTLYQ